MDSPLGPIYLALSEEGICNVKVGGSLDNFLTRLDPMAYVERDPAALAPVAAQLREYFAGARLQFEVPLDLSRLTAFQRSVLKATRDIPAGTVRSYRQVAEAIGKPQASRAVGQVLARNPVPILIPCHRVIANDGSLGGYGSGLAHKRLLLDLEGAMLPSATKKTRLTE